MKKTILLPDEEQYKRILVAYDLKSNKETVTKITEKYNVSRGVVNYSRDLFKGHHEEREQIVLGSLLGDAYLQKLPNGRFILRETHSLHEKEYAFWKYLMYDNWTNGVSSTLKNNNTALEIFTSQKVSDELAHYYELSKDEIIDKINIYGLIIYILDDGWYAKNSKLGSFRVSSKVLSYDNMHNINNKFQSYGIKSTLKEDGDSTKTIYIPQIYNEVLLAYCKILFKTTKIDVIQKKFGQVIKNQQLIV